MTPAYALAHVFLPNLIKLKGHTNVMSAMERRHLVFFDALWAQAQTTHHPHLTSQMRDPYRIATISLPQPRELGEAYLAGLVIRIDDPGFLRYFTLEHDYVLATRSDRTVLAEREGQRHIRCGDGPVLTGDADADARAFVDSFMARIVPGGVTRL